MNPSRSSRWLQACLQEPGAQSSAWLELSGWSMAPALRPGDWLRVEPLVGDKLQAGEVVVALRAGLLVTHRVARVDAEYVVTRGDNCAADDPPLPRSALVGAAVEVRRGARLFATPSKNEPRLLAAKFKARLGAGVRGLASTASGALRRGLGARLAWFALAMGSLLGCAAAHAEVRPSSGSKGSADQKCDCADIDPKKIGDVALLDRENQENLEKVGALERTVAELQERLARLAKQPPPAPAPAPQSSAAAAGKKSKKKAEVPARDEESDEPPAKQPARKAAPPPRAADEGMVSVSGKRVRVRLSNELVFKAGGDRISRSGRAALVEVAAVLKTTPSQRIEVNGHTDDSPTGKAWEDNWQLSLERAHRVVAFLIAQGLDRHRFVASGFADTDPVAENDSPRSMEHNRRVEIFIEPTGEKPSP